MLGFTDENQAWEQIRFLISSCDIADKKWSYDFINMLSIFLVPINAVESHRRLQVENILKKNNPIHKYPSPPSSLLLLN